MTKKDYELFADTIYTEMKGRLKETDFAYIVTSIGQVFKRDNGLFQQEKFERACYEGKHIRKSISGRV